jgi:hypothetical protein
MADPCCAAFKVESLSPEALRDEPFRQDETAVAAWRPLITWSEDAGAFVINDIAIFFCPWCGASLPDRTLAVIEEVRRNGIWIDFAAPGGLEASVNGVFVDPEKLLAELHRAAANHD